MYLESLNIANCARSFLRLFDQDPRLAYDHYVAGEQLVAEIRRLAEGT